MSRRWTAGNELRQARQGFNSREKDQEANLFNNGVRKLDDGEGRFTSIDPLWEKFPAWSPYQYGYNNTMSMTDPRGMQGMIVTPPSLAFPVFIETQVNVNLFVQRNQDNLWQMASGGAGVISGLATAAGGYAMCIATDGLAIPLGGAALITSGTVSTGLSGAKFMNGLTNIIQNEANPDEPYKEPAPIPTNTGGAIGVAVQWITGYEAAPFVLGAAETTVTMIVGGFPTEPIGATSFFASQVQFQLDMGQLAFAADAKEKEAERKKASYTNPDASAQGNTPLPNILQ